MSNVMVFDLGGGVCKAGVAGQQEPLKVFPNGIGKSKGDKRSYVGADIVDECEDLSAFSLRRPHDKGYLVAPEIQREVLQHTMKHVLRMDPSRSHCVITEPVLNLPQLRALTEQLVFDMGFQSFVSMPAPVLALIAHAKDTPGIAANAAGCGLVIDAGFSFTHIVPVFNWKVLGEGVKRINLGGRALTNYFKELVSFRSINLMDETFIVEHIKDQVLFVSDNMTRDLEAARRGRNSPFRLEYSLPDGIKDKWGHIVVEGETNNAAKAPQDPNQQAPDNILQINNERFVVAEALFHPGDLGLDQAGIAEACLQAVSDCEPALRPLLFSNILLIGGSCKIPGFLERLNTELRPLVPLEMDMRITLPKDPLSYAWRGGSMLGASSDFQKRAVTRAAYQQSKRAAAV